ncbi:hypothetical protein NECID01_0768 [Nematocida sp. AWRm77]|nr:hypothetical protein NECID01_0768 [Nematocida sp. AWRm77]
MLPTDIFLVFDLNGTLLKRVKEDKQRIMAIRNPDGRVPPCNDLIYLRPHIGQLAEFLHKHGISYVFWTTAMEHNGVYLLNAVTETGMNQHKGSFFYTHSTPIKGHPYKRSKDLKLISTKYSVPLEQIRLIDDEEIKSMYPGLHIPISEYSPENQEDTALLSLISTLSSIIGLDKENHTSQA